MKTIIQENYINSNLISSSLCLMIKTISEDREGPFYQMTVIENIADKQGNRSIAGLLH